MKLGHARAQTDPTSEEPRAERAPYPPSALQGDELLAWLTEHDPASVPTDAQLASVSLQGIDWIDEATYLHHGLFEDFWTGRPDDVLPYFEREDRAAVFAEAGARLNGWNREKAERHNLPRGR